MKNNDLVKSSVWYTKVPPGIEIPNFDGDYHLLQFNILNKRNQKFCEWILGNFPEELKWMEKLYWFVNGLIERPKCTVCEKKRCIFINFYKGYINVCGVSCSSKKSRSKANETYKKNNNITDPNIKCSLSDPTIRKRIRETCNKYYGGNSTMCREDIKTKNILTQRENNIKKFKFLLKYTPCGNWICKCPHPNENVSGKCLYCNRSFEIKPSVHQDRMKLNIETCTKILPHRPRLSNIELEDRKIIDELGFEAKYNKIDIIKPFELDIYVESLNLGIEENGLVYHNINCIYRNIKKDYHMLKQRLCKEKGIELISFWEGWNLRDKKMFLSAKINKESLDQWKQLWFPDIRDNEWPLDLGWPPKEKKILKIVEHHCWKRDPHSKKEKFYECYDSGIAILE